MKIPSRQKASVTRAKWTNLSDPDIKVSSLDQLFLSMRAIMVLEISRSYLS